MKQHIDAWKWAKLLRVAEKFEQIEQGAGREFMRNLGGLCFLRKDDSDREVALLCLQSWKDLSNWGRILKTWREESV